MSDASSRRGFLREIAKAAARRIPEVPKLDADVPMPAAATPLLTAEEIERYSRQLVLPEWSELAQVALRDASVLVVGAGALGAPVALYLAGAGVGRLGIVDDDLVEISNLQRQPMHFTPDQGVPKVESAAAKLRFLNPEILIEPYHTRLTADNAAGLVEGQDLVIDCSDSFATRYAVNAACCAAGVSLIEGGVVGWSGLVMTIRPGQTSCYRCAFPVEPVDAPTCAEVGVLGPAAGVVGSLMALEALKVLSGAAAALQDEFLQIDLATLDVMRVRVMPLPECPDCPE
jgi:molybdopterin/thiamine biosynthesis adenylyltransferase